MEPGASAGALRTRPDARLAEAAIGFAAVTLGQVAASRAEIVVAPTAVVMLTATLLVGSVVGATVAWALRSRWPSAILTSAAAAALLPASLWFGASDSTLAFLVAVVATAVTAAQLLMAGVAVVGRTLWSTAQRWRTRRGYPPLQIASSSWLERLHPQARTAVALAMPSLMVLAVSVFIDTTPPDQPGLVGVIASASGRLWGIAEGLSVSVLAGSIVLFAQHHDLGAALTPGHDRDGNGP